MNHSLTKRGVIGVVDGIYLMATTLGAAAQDEIAASGNGGITDASANGGAVAADDVSSGTNAGNAIGVGDTAGGVAVDGGAVANSTGLDVAAIGGAAIADGSGGDDNIAAQSDVTPVPPPVPEPTPGPEPPPPGPTPSDFFVDGSGTATLDQPATCALVEDRCTGTTIGVFTGTPIEAGTFTGTLIAQDFELDPNDPDVFVASDVVWRLTLTETSTGDTVDVRLVGQLDVQNGGATYTFSGTYTITGGTGQFANASGTGTASASGTNFGLGAGAIDSLVLHGSILIED